MAIDYHSSSTRPSVALSVACLLGSEKVLKGDLPRLARNRQGAKAERGRVSTGEKGGVTKMERMKKQKEQLLLVGF